MKAVRWIFVLSVLVAGWPIPMAAVQNDVERVHQVVPLPAGGTLKLHNFSGRVTITGADRSDVAIDAVRKAPKNRLDRIKLDISRSGSAVIIEANKRPGAWLNLFGTNVVETDFDIQVPRQCALDINVFSSPVTVTGVSGSHRAGSFSGTLTFEGMTQPIRAKTFSGDIRVGVAGSSRPEVNLNTFSGSIEVRVSPQARANVDFDSFSGELTSDLPLMLSRKHGRHLQAQLNGGAQAAAGQGGASEVRLKTFSGDVRIVQ